MDATNQSPLLLDDEDFYEDLAKTYVKHEIGYFILAPSGTGKTFFTSKQEVLNWIDGDILWPLAGADMTGEEWINDSTVVEETNNNCDLVTERAKNRGFWVIGASNSWLKPDAIVLPDWETHMSYIKKRQSDNATFDGGATLNDIDGLKSHIKWIKDKWSEEDVPYFTSIEAVAKFLATN